MKIPFAPAYMFWIPPWDVDHHVYRSPLQISIHTAKYFISVRPFSGYAQGGDRRGEIKWRTDRIGPSPYEREKSAKWVIEDEKPEIWRDLVLGERGGPWLYCVRCLHEQEVCSTIASQGRHTPQPARRWVFLRHLWLIHIKERKRCKVKWKAEDLWTENP